MQEPIASAIESPQYEDIGFQPLPPTVAPRASLSAPAHTLASVIAPQNKPLNNPVPLPGLSSRPKSPMPLLPTHEGPTQKAPIVPPKSTQNNKVKPSTVIYDRIPKKPVEAPVPKPKNVPKPSFMNAAEPVPSKYDSGESLHSHPKPSSQQPLSSPPSSVEAPTLSVKPQPEVSVSTNPSSMAASKEDQNTYGTALFAINESLRLLVGKIEKMEQKQTQFDEDISLLKSKGGFEEKKVKMPLEIHSMTQQDVSNCIICMHNK